MAFASTSTSTSNARRSAAQSAAPAATCCTSSACAAELDPQRMDGEEYLDRYGVTAYMKDMVTLLLENRPEKPIEFIAEYFRTVIHGSSPLLRAYRYVRLSRLDQDAFEDNLVAAYGALDARRGVVVAAELQRILRLICSDCPVQLSRSILLLIDKHDLEPITFKEFSVAVRACLQYEVYFTRAEALLSAHVLPGGGIPRGLLQLIEGVVSYSNATDSHSSRHTEIDLKQLRAEACNELHKLKQPHTRGDAQAASAKEALALLFRATIAKHPHVDAAVAAAAVRIVATANASSD